MVGELSCLLSSFHQNRLDQMQKSEGSDVGGGGALGTCM